MGEIHQVINTTKKLNGMKFWQIFKKPLVIDIVSMLGENCVGWVSGRMGKII